MFANFKSKLLKVDLRKGGKKIIVLETNARLSAGELEALNEMIDQEVITNFDSQVISYRIRKNAKTDKPVITYTVSETGVVEEMKRPEGEQLELDMGLPAEKTPIKEEVAEIPRDIVDDFVAAGLAPRFDGLEYDLPEIIQRHADGESYSRLAAELDLSTGKLAELLEDYYKRIAPLAAKWDEWRQGQSKPLPVGDQPKSEGGAEVKEDSEIVDQSESADDSTGDDYAGKEIVITVRGPDEDLIEYVFPIINGTGRAPTKYVNYEDTGIVLGEDIKADLELEHSQGCYAIEDLLGAGGELRDVQLSNDELSWTGDSDGTDQGDDDGPNAWERDVMGADGDEDDGDAEQPATEEISQDDLDEYILNQKPQFDGVAYDFPALLARKKAGETWMEISKSLHITSGQLSAAWTKYKNLVRKMISGGAA